MREGTEAAPGCQSVNRRATIASAVAALVALLGDEPGAGARSKRRKWRCDKRRQCGSSCCRKGRVCERGRCVNERCPADRQCDDICCPPGEVCAAGRTIVRCLDPVGNCPAANGQACNGIGSCRCFASISGDVRCGNPVVGLRCSQDETCRIELGPGAVCVSDPERGAFCARACVDDQI